MVVYQGDASVLAGVVEKLPCTMPVAVVDNSPTARLAEFFKTYPQVQYIFASENLGYGKGHNLALKKSPPSQYHLILNPDVYVEEDTLEGLIRCLQEMPDAGIVAPRICNVDGTTQYLNRRYATVADLVIRRLLPADMFPARRAWHEMRDVGYDQLMDVESMSGSLMLCRRDVLEMVGGFDPRYFMYFEDFDLSRTVQSRGFRTVYCPSVKAVHGWERASYKNISLTITHIANMVRYFNKWGWKWW